MLYCFTIYHTRPQIGGDTLSCEPQEWAPELPSLLLSALVGLSTAGFSVWAAAGSQMAFKFSSLVSCLHSPTLQLHTLGCYIRFKSPKLAFSDVQNNVSDRTVAFKKKKTNNTRATGDMTERAETVSVQLSMCNMNFCFPRRWKMPLYCLSTKALK